MVLGECELDVFVIGGGVMGVGMVFDVVIRGLRIGLVEVCDFASGMLLWLSKLFYGGLRYFE